MRNIRAIAVRELQAYFNSPMAYIVVCAFLLLAGWLYFTPLLVAGTSSMRGFFGLAPILFVVFAPAISMRLVSEEIRSGTLELLTTMPVRDVEVVTGKFLAGLAVIASALAMTGFWAVTVEIIGDLDWGPVIGGYLGLVLCASTLIAIGLMTSAWSRNQIVAFILALVIGLGLWLLDKVTFFVPPALAGLLEYLSIDYHFQNIARGVIDSRDLLYYLSVTALALFGAIRGLARRHV
jgi:ABC-2 type transport system permease protein